MRDREITEEAADAGLAFVTAVAEQVQLGVPATRLELLAEAAAPIHLALRGLAAIDLGETIPATSFDPSWID